MIDGSDEGIDEPLGPGVIVGDSDGRDELVGRGDSVGRNDRDGRCEFDGLSLAFIEGLAEGGGEGRNVVEG